MPRGSGNYSVCQTSDGFNVCAVDQNGVVWMRQGVQGGWIGLPILTGDVIDEVQYAKGGILGWSYSSPYYNVYWFDDVQPPVELDGLTFPRGVWELIGTLLPIAGALPQIT